MNGVNVNSQSMLAKLLATENITVQYKNGIKTAMFDLKNRVLMLPIWENISEDLRHLLIGHETGHALDTPDAAEYEKASNDVAARIFGSAVNDKNIRAIRGFINVIEDARIDKRQKRRYPGLRKNYLLGYKELFDRDFFSTANRDVNSFNFIDRANIYLKGGSINLKIEFTPQERKLLKQIEDAETFDEVINITEAVYRYCQDSLNNSDTDDLFIPTDDESDESDEGEWIDGNFDDYDDFSDDSESDEKGDGEDSDEEDDGEGESEADKGSAPTPDDLTNEDDTKGINSKGAGSNAEVTDKAPESETDRAWEEKIQTLAKDDNTDYIYLSLPDVDWKKAVHDYKRVLSDWRTYIKTVKRYTWAYALDTNELNKFRAEMMAWRQKEKDSISFLVKEFEARKSAEMYARISIAKTGVIDTNKLHSYKYNDDIFRRLTVLPEGKNHGFVMIVDWSGSMLDNLHQTIQQLFTLVLFCRQIQVPFEVYTFKDSDAEYPWIYPADRKNVIGLSHVVLRQVLSSKMTTSELNEAMAVLWAISLGAHVPTDSLGGTPLNEAVILAPHVVNQFKAKNKLEIVNTIFLTDGDSNAIAGVKNENYKRGVGRFQKYFYNDVETGKTYDVQPYAGWGTWGVSNTTTFLKIVKDKTGSNLIGFYLWGESWHRFCGRFGVTSLGLSKVTKFWKDNKFYPVKSEGYDDYYVIDAKALKQTVNELKIDNTKSTRMMAKEFSKFAAKKTVNRVLLRQFIDHVVSQAKKIA